MNSQDVYSFTVPAELTERGGHLIDLKISDTSSPILRPSGQKLVREFQRSVPELEAVGIVAPKSGVAIVTPISGQNVNNVQQVVDKIMDACGTALGGRFAVPEVGQRRIASVR